MTDLADRWRVANQKLRHLAECITSATDQPTHLALGYLTALGEELKHTETLLRETQSPTSPRRLDEPVLEYRNCLKRLLEVLPALQAQLLAERSRLEPERERLQAAAAWAQCTKALLK